MKRCLIVLTMILVIGSGKILSQEKSDTTDLPSGKLQVVATAHLDTQWRWTIQRTINEFLPATLHDNFKLIDQFPSYIFNFEGSFRYELFEEYYPKEFDRMREYIEDDRWRVTGSWTDAVDVNVPSFESLVRQTLYGNSYFKRNFGKTSRNIFLPDCFGFGYALPSIAKHSGLTSFSTQKLTWGSWVGIPFDIGLWEGVDGSEIVSAFNPGSYGTTIREDLSRDSTWGDAIRRQGESTGLYAAYRYYGTGDTGGAPDSASVAWLEKSINSDGPIEVSATSPDEVVDLISTVDRSQLPRYKGELTMTSHGVGCYTSQAAMKRWNRKNELLADAAERASVIASYLDVARYPGEMLRDTWVRFLWHQFHDDLTGTSIPEAYEFSWSDEILCQNRFASILTNAVTRTAPMLDTRTEGIPLIVYNPLSIERKDIVEATVRFDDENISHIRVFGPDENEVPSDLLETNGNEARILFLAKTPSVGYAVYDVRPSSKPCELETELSVTDSTLENEKYTVTLRDGDVVSVYDRIEKRELLGEPLRLELLNDIPQKWPAWEIDLDDMMSEPLDPFVAPTRISINENGRSRISLDLVQQTEHSTIRQTISLAAGSERLEFDCDIDWYEQETLLKAAFSLATPNDSATYDLGLGTIKRGLNSDSLYEVPAQQWADLEATDGSYGVSILNDCKYGWDHPTPDKLRLTLIHTPGIDPGWNWLEDERSQDNGHHQFKYAIYGHLGSWQEAQTAWQAARLNQPLTAFQTTDHHGALGREFSLLEVDKSQSVMVNAVKMAEDSDEVVIRVRQLTGEPTDSVTIKFNTDLIEAREVNGMEEQLAPTMLDEGNLTFSLTPYQPKAFAVGLKTKRVGVRKESKNLPIQLPFNLDGISSDDNRCDGDFDGQGNSLSADLLPGQMRFLDNLFSFGPTADGDHNVVKCQGQVVDLPEERMNSGDRGRLIHLVGASIDGPVEAEFTIGDMVQSRTILDYDDPIGQWNNRLIDGEFHDDCSQITPAYINREPVAWYGSHRHTSDCENEAYRFTYLYHITLELPEDATTLTLPADDRIRILSGQIETNAPEQVILSQPLYDETNRTLAVIRSDSSSFGESSQISLSSPVPGTRLFYTLDGTVPTYQSPKYEKPIVVSSTTTIKAMAQLEGEDKNHISSKTVTKLSLRDALDITPVGPGLKGKYYEGEWEILPDFDSIPPVRPFVCDTVAIPDFARDEDYGLIFRGTIQIPEDGIYSLSVASDDGSRLFVSDTLVANNDGLHGDEEVSGMIGLKAGFHRIEVQMFQLKGGEALRVSIAGPGLPKQTVPANMLYQ